MRAKILIMIAALLLSLVGPWESLAQTKKSPAKKPAVSAKKKAPVKQRVVRRRTARRPTAPANQRVPTRDRYAEIQQALADAGHFSGEPDGAWNQASMAAMKAFQAEQGFEPTGKIDSRSLIRLGLGPQYDAVSTDAPATSPADGTRQPG